MFALVLFFMFFIPTVVWIVYNKKHKWSAEKKYNYSTNKYEKTGRKGDGFYISLSFSIITMAAIILIFSLSCVTIPASSALNKTKNIQNYRSRMTILVNRRDHYIALIKDQLEALIKDQLEQYPKYEKSVIDEVVSNLKQNNVAILLRFPELKANQTISQAVHDTMAVSDAVYGLRTKILDEQTALRKMNASPWYIKLWWPSTHDALKS